MSGVDQQNQTMVSLREYMERRLDDHCNLNESRFRALEESTRRANEILELRLLSMNEFRDSLRDQTKTYVTRPELDNQKERVEEIRIRQSNMDGRMAAYGVALGVVFTLIQIALRFL